VVDLTRDSLVRALDVRILTTELKSQVLDSLLPVAITFGNLALKVDRDQGARVDEWMCEERIKEVLELLLSLLNKRWLHVAPKFLLWERGDACIATDLAFDHRLELTQ